MRKRALFVGVLFVLTMALAANAYADDTTAWQGMWNSVGGFLHNLLPWNWGEWLGGGS